MSFAVEIAERRAALNTDSRRGRVDIDRAHTREINDDSFIAESPAPHVVTATSDRRKQTVVPRKVYSRDDVGNA